MDDPSIFRWLLDVHLAWPTRADETNHSTAQWASSDDIQSALRLLPQIERDKVLRFHFPRDAKLCLGSNLLKHRAIVSTCHVPWNEATISEGDNRKPCYKPTDPTNKGIEFNVSHHGTLVALVGCTGQSRNLGVDIVQMNWEKDYPAVMKESFESWVQTYEVVFSQREAAEISEYLPPTSFDLQDEIRAKLRHFYAHWCLKEAYVKMTGEALLAPWLKELEFRNVRVPLPTSQMQPAAGTGDWGQVNADIETWFKGTRVTNVRMELQAYGEDYMIGTAVSDPTASLAAFQILDTSSPQILAEWRAG